MKAAFSISEFVNPSGVIVWRVSGTKKGGTRVRKNYTTLEFAMARKQELESETLNMPTEHHLHRSRLTADQLLDAELALPALAGKVSLCQAVQFYVENFRAPVSSPTLPVAIEQFLESKRQQNVRPHTLGNYSARLQHLSGTTSCLVCDVLSAHLTAFIHRPGIGMVTKSNDHRALSAFFAWCKKMGFCEANPMVSIAPITTDAIDPKVLSIADCRKLLSVVSEFESGKMLPYVVLGLFCGIRPTELQRLTWDAIDLYGYTVTIGATIAKMRRRRIVRISDNAVEWLTTALMLPIHWRYFDRQFLKLRVESGIAWSPDVLRHTAISHHLNITDHEGKTAAWAGNSPDVIQRHYKALVTKADSEAFWSILPSDKNAIVIPMVA